MHKETKITAQRLKELERAEAKLNALEAGGVDNWEWYGESLKDYNANIGREEQLEEILDEIQTILCSGAYEPSERGAGFTFSIDAQEEALKYLVASNIQFGDSDA